jgi:arylformamidase
MLYDISQTLRPDLPVWPGDTRVQAKSTWTLSPECPVNVAALTLSTHSGAHADAPLHYDAQGQDIASVALDAYVGPARVIDARDWPLIDSTRLAPFLGDAPPRILVRTFDVFPHDQWPKTWTCVAPEAIDAIAEKGGVLIGIDGPSLDPETSKTMTAHHALRRHGLRILEGLVLDHIPTGDYDLIALPLKLAGLDASPVRAILRTLS